MNFTPHNVVKCINLCAKTTANVHIKNIRFSIVVNKIAISYRIIVYHRDCTPVTCTYHILLIQDTNYI